MEEEEEEGEDGYEDEDDEEEEEEEEGGPESLFDALAAAQEAGERYRDSERSKISESCRLPDDFLVTAFKSAIRCDALILTVDSKIRGIIFV